jgi:hypothetical protein
MLLEDIGYPPEKKLFEGVIDPETITEMDLQRFGAVILDKYKQVWTVWIRFSSSRHKLLPHHDTRYRLSQCTSESRRQYNSLAA